MAKQKPKSDEDSYYFVLAVFDSHTDEQARFAIVRAVDGDQEEEDHDDVLQRCRIED
jgi:hypothetical protein